MRKGDPSSRKNGDYFKRDQRLDKASFLRFFFQKKYYLKFYCDYKKPSNLKEIADSWNLLRKKNCMNRLKVHLKDVTITKQFKKMLQADV